MFIEALQTPSPKTVVTTLAAVAATAVIVRSVLRDHVPPELRRYVVSKLQILIARSISSQLTLVVDEFDGEGLTRNDLFRAATIYLKPTVAPQTTRFKAALPKKETNLSITMETNQQIFDSFNGVKLTWKLVSSTEPERRSLELSFHRKHRDMVMENYLSHVLERSKEAREEEKTAKLFRAKGNQWRLSSRKPRLWESVILSHPATFDTLAVEAEAKRAVMEDLQRFVERRGFYRKVGRAWKRGYLLFGSPGTGKTSLVAAIANYLNFDIYDLELSSIRSKGELQKLVISTGNRSVLVVEDVEANSETLQPARRRRSKVTLLGFLKLTDGLWSSCGDERIIVVTTNYKDRLDPAVLRAGRMDVQVHLTYCALCGFRMLASNYLRVNEHRLFPEIEQFLETMKVTPAEVGEELMKIEEPEASLSSLIEFLKRKKETEAQCSV